jgi:uncharacterized protein HemX
MIDSPSNDNPPRTAASSDGDWTALAASLAAEKAAGAARPSPATEQPRPAPRQSLLSAFALVLALIAILVAGMLWWQYRAFYVSLDQNDNLAAQSLEKTRAEQRAIQDRIKGLETDVETLRQLNSGVNARVEALPGRFVDLEQRLDAVQGGSFAARSDLLRSEAEYYLSIANTELSLAGDWDNAIKALELADGRLAEIANPEFAPVREAIAGELLALRSVRLPDLEGVVFSLGRLASRADSLPLRSDVRGAEGGSRAAVDDAEPGLGRLWLTIKRTIAGLVRVERRDAPIEPALTAAQRILARRQFEVELELARVAALRTHAQGFQSALQSATEILQRDFEAGAPEVEGAISLLKEMQGLDVAPKRPDIGGSLNLLRAAGGN